MTCTSKRIRCNVEMRLLPLLLSASVLILLDGVAGGDRIESIGSGNVAGNSQRSMLVVLLAEVVAANKTGFTCCHAATSAV